MMAFVMLNGLALVGEAASGVIKGVKKIATAISDVQAKKCFTTLSNTWRRTTKRSADTAASLPPSRSFGASYPRGREDTGHAK